MAFTSRAEVSLKTRSWNPRRRIPKAIAPELADFATACATGVGGNGTVRQRTSRVDVRITAWMTRSAAEATDASPNVTVEPDCQVGI